MLIRSVSRLVALAAGGLVLAAPPAGADPAKPTDYRSTIDAVTPERPGLEVSIVGGDSFLRVQVEEGHALVVEGYQGEPYIQILEDGTVQENLRSEATYLNEDRYGDVEVPPDLEPDDEPEWRTVDDDGEHAWHDHRIHWMSPDRRPGIEPGDVVQTQDVPMALDGEPVTVTVSVHLEEPVSALPWAAVVVVTAGALLALAWRRGLGALPIVAGAALIGSGLAVVAGQGELGAMPAGTGASALVVIVPAVALVAAVVAGALLRRNRSLAGIALLASAAALAGWAVLRLSVLWKPVLPTELPANLDRLATSLAVAVAVAVAVLTLRSGAVTPAPLTDDDE